jgi:hypothetical protein
MRYAKFKGNGEHYFAISDKPNENGLYEGITVNAGNQKSITTISITGRWFGTMYDACDKKEFENAYKSVLKHISEVYQSKIN